MQGTLALTLREGEAVLIGDPPIAVVRLVRITGNQRTRAILSISADRGVAIDREELRARKLADRAAAGTPSAERSEL